MEKISPDPRSTTERVPNHVEGAAFRNAALLSSALLASFPQVADAWETSYLPNQTEIVDSLDSLGLPTIEALREAGSHVSYLIPAEEGKPTLIHIRQQHRLPGERTTSEEIIETGTIQKEIYDTITLIAAGQPYVDYFPEGYSEKMITSGYLENLKQLQHEFYEQVVPLMTSSPSTPVNLDSAIEATADHYKQTRGETLPRLGYAKLAALGSLLLQRSDITAAPSRFTSLIEGTPETFHYFYNGGLEQSFFDGFITNIVGCENHDLFNGENDLQHTLDINPERERIVSNCFMEQLTASDQPYAVTVYGGSHNFQQEIDPGIGYLVLTPNSYDVESYFTSID